MKKRIKFPITFPLFLIFFLLFSGCTLFKSTPDNTRLFNLGSKYEENAVPSIHPGSLSIAIYHFPDYLNRSYMVTKIGKHEFKNQLRYRWATPLSEVIMHCVHQSISHSFPKMCVYEFPQDTVPRVDLSLQLDIECLEIDEKTRQITFAGMGEFLDADSKPVNRSNFEFHEQFGNGEDYYGEIVAKIEQVILSLCKVLIGQMDFLLLKKETEVMKK